MTYKNLIYLLLLLPLIFGNTLINAEEIKFRTKHQKVFKNLEGGYTARIYNEPIHYKEVNGRFMSIDPTIVNSSRRDYDYEVTKGLYHAYFKNDLTADRAILLQDDQKSSIGYRLAGFGYYDLANSNFHPTTILQTSQAEVSKEKIVYRNMLPGIEMRLSYLTSRLKEELVITQTARSLLPAPGVFGVREADALVAFYLELQPDSNLQAFVDRSVRIDNTVNGNFNLEYEGDKTIGFKRAEKNNTFFLPPDFAYLQPSGTVTDSGSYNIELRRRIIARGNGIYLVSGIPYSWLMALPIGDVIIDPTIIISDVADDTWIETASNRGSYDYFIVGKHGGGYAKKRSLIKFDITGIPSYADIDDAQLNVYYKSKNKPSWVSESFQSRYVRANAVYTPWDESSANVNSPWNIAYGDFGVGPSSGADFEIGSYGEAYFTSTTQVWKSFDITSIAQNWIDGTWDNNGIMLWATNENIEGYDLRMWSKEYSADTTKRPYLEIDYSIPPLSKLYYIKDHLGSTRVVVEEDGDTKASYDYYPFGLQMPGRTAVTGGGTNRNLFTGKEHDTETNWDYFGARYYGNALGRFLSIDPHADDYPSLNPYNYVGNNPLSYVDPTGMDSTASNSSSDIPESDFVTVNGMTLHKNVAAHWHGAVLPDQSTRNSANGTTQSYRQGERSDNSSTSLSLYSMSLAFNGIGSASTGMEYSNQRNNMWKGKNGKWNPMSRSGNLRTGLRGDVLAKAQLWRVASKVAFYGGIGVSMWDAGVAASNGDVGGIGKAAIDMGMGYVGTLGPIGFTVGTVYFVVDATIGWENTVSIEGMARNQGKANFHMGKSSGPTTRYNGRR